MTFTARQPIGSRLSMPRTALIGRDADIEGLLRLLGDDSTTLVTLTGPGGVGKTRIALHVAHAAPNHLACEVAFVPLAAVQSDAGVLRAIGQALGITETQQASLQDRLVSTMADRDMLLVLDNFEHVLESRPLIHELLSALPDLTVLVTSQARLHLETERVVLVAPLSVPDKTSALPLEELRNVDAVRLFVDRAQAAQPQFAITEHNAETIVGLCRQLDGLPLAIELAAARINAFPPEILLERLRSSFLNALETTGPDRPDRHRTLNATISWSHTLLTEAERQFLQCVSVFAGGFSLDAADRVWRAMGAEPSSAHRGVSSLVDKSFLRPIDGPGSEPRYLMLETIRAFASGQLVNSGKADRAARHHAHWCTRLALEAESGMVQQDQARWIDRLTVEHNNLRSALTWAIEQDPELALEMANALWLFWYVQGHLVEGAQWIDRALNAGTQADPHLRAKALNNLGNLVYELGDLERARKLYDASLSAYKAVGDARGAANILNNLGMLANAVGDPDGARSWLQESLDLRHTLDDPPGLAPTMNNLGDVAIHEGDGATARHWNMQALAIAQQLGNTRRVAHSLHNLGIAQRCEANDQAAIGLCDHSLKLFEEVRDHAGIAIVLHSLARIAMGRGDQPTARTHLARALDLHRKELDRRGYVVCLEAAAILAERSGNHESCVRIAGAADAMRGQMVPLQPPMDRSAKEAALANAKHALGDAQFESAWIMGGTLSRELALEFALTVLTTPARPQSVLTQRELEVIQLIAQGCSNQEIADRLYISVRTVKQHVTNIFTKLDISSRTAAVAYAHQHGLASH